MRLFIIGASMYIGEDVSKIQNFGFTEKFVLLLSLESSKKIIFIFDEFLKVNPSSTLYHDTYCGYNCLFYAIAKHKLPIIRKIVAVAGKKILGAKSNKEWTPLMYAIHSGKNAKKKLATVRELITLGADVNQSGVDSAGKKVTPLTFALGKKDSAIIKHLILSKATIGQEELPYDLQLILKNAHEQISKSLLMLQAFQDRQSSLAIFPKEILEKLAALHYLVDCQLCFRDAGD